MSQQKQEIKSSDLISCIGLPLRSQHIFGDNDFMEASKRDAVAYLPVAISKTLRQPNRFTLFQITVDELHIKVDDKQVIVAIFIKLDNRDLLKKMEAAIGGEYLASGMAVGYQPVNESYFLWNYKGGCVSLNLNAKKVQLKPKMVQDNGLVIFYNCKMVSYLKMSE